MDVLDDRPSRASSVARQITVFELYSSGPSHEAGVRPVMLLYVVVPKRLLLQQVSDVKPRPILNQHQRTILGAKTENPLCRIHAKSDLFVPAPLEDCTPHPPQATNLGMNLAISPSCKLMQADSRESPICAPPLTVTLQPPIAVVKRCRTNNSVFRCFHSVCYCSLWS